MAKFIKSPFPDNLFAKEIAAAKEFLGEITKVTKEFTELGTKSEKAIKALDFKKSADIAKLTSEMAALEKQVENLKKTKDKELEVSSALSKLEKQEIILRDRLTASTTDQAKTNADLTLKIQAQNKANKEASKTLSDYEKLLKKTNESQKKFKEAAAEFGVNSEQAKEALDIFNKFDLELREINKTAKDGRRDVGRYEDAYETLVKQVTDVRKETKRLTAEFGKNSKESKQAVRELNDLEGQLEGIESAAKGTEKKIKGLSNAFKAFAGAAIVIKLLELSQQAFSKNTEGVAAFEKAIAGVVIAVQVFISRVVKAFPIMNAKIDMFFISIKLGFAELKNLFGGNAESVENLKKEYDDLASKTLPSLSSVFSGMGEEIADLTAKNVALIDDTIEYRKEIIALEKAITKLLPEQQALQALYDNDRISLEEKLLIGEKLLKSNAEIFEKEIQIAAKRKYFATERAKIDKNNLDAQEEASAATREFAELQSSFAMEQNAVHVEQQMIREDLYERNLDFYIDDFDNFKTINERIIADATQTFKRRKELLNLTAKEAEASYKNQQKEVNKSLVLQGKDIIDFNDLIKNTSEENARILSESGLSDVLVGRGLEIIRERRLVIQDMAEAQRDLSAAEQDSNDILSDVYLTRKALLDLEKDGVNVAKLLKELEEKRANAEIEALKERLKLAKKGSAQRLAIEQQLNNLLLDQYKTKADKELEIETKKIAKVKALTEKAISFLSNASSAIFEKQQDKIDARIEKSQENQERIQKAIVAGSEGAKESLTLAQKEEADAIAAREEMAKKERAVQASLAFIKLLSAKAGANDPNAFASAAADFAQGAVFASSLADAFFNEGTELVEKDSQLRGKKVHNGQDGYIIGVDGSERIMTGDQNAKLGGLSNDFVADMGQMVRMGDLVPKSTAANMLDSALLLGEISKTNALLEGLPRKIPVAEIDYNRISRQLERVVKAGSNNTKWGN